jgi:hypothetical protein
MVFGDSQRVLAIYHAGMSDETAIRERYEAMGSRLDERGRRLFAAADVIR